jgi:hypothetical protein
MDPQTIDQLLGLVGFVGLLILFTAPVSIPLLIGIVVSLLDGSFRDYEPPSKRCPHTRRSYMRDSPSQSCDDCGMIL